MTLRLLALALGTFSLLLTAADQPRPRALEAAPPPSAQLEPAPDLATVVGSCSLGPRSCVEWEGSYAGVDLKGRCKKLKGTWGDAACPAARRIGSCRQRELSSDDRMVTISYAPVKPADAKAACGKQPRAVFLKGSGAEPPAGAAQR